MQLLTVNELTFKTCFIKEIENSRLDQTIFDSFVSVNSHVQRRGEDVAMRKLTGCARVKKRALNVPKTTIANPQSIKFQFVVRSKLSKNVAF